MNFRISSNSRFCSWMHSYITGGFFSSNFFCIKGLGLFAVPGRDPEKILLRQAPARSGTWWEGGVTGKGVWWLSLGLVETDRLNKKITESISIRDHFRGFTHWWEQIWWFSIIRSRNIAGSEISSPGEKCPSLLCRTKDFFCTLRIHKTDASNGETPFCLPNPAERWL